MPYALVQAPTTNPSRCASRCRGAAAVSRDYLSASLPLYLSTSLPLYHAMSLSLKSWLRYSGVT